MQYLITLIDTGERRELRLDAENAATAVRMALAQPSNGDRPSELLSVIPVACDVEPVHA